MAAAQYRVREFAQMAGVTLRALHHYDRLGLLKAERSNSGYRVYREADLARLEQIVALKFIGVPVKRIKELLNAGEFEFSRALHSQRIALEQKKRSLELTLNAIRAAEAELRSGGEPDIRKIVEVIEMQNHTDWTTKYFRPAAQDKLQARRAEWTPSYRRGCKRTWTDLFHDIRANLERDPASP